jgi:hypothetical protein
MSKDAFGRQKSMKWLKDAIRGPSYPRDRFGLPLPATGEETVRNKLTRQAQTRRDGEMILREIFANLASSLGDDAARALFARCVRPPASRGSKGRGPQDTERDLKLLDRHDLIVEAIPSASPEVIAKILYAEGPFFGSSADAIAKHIRRLLNDRVERREKEAKQQAALKSELERDYPGLMDKYSGKSPMTDGEAE